VASFPELTATGFLAIGTEAIVQPVDQSAEIFRVQIGGVQGNEVLLVWSASSTPLFPPHRGSRIRVVGCHASGRDYALEGSVVREDQNGIVVAADGPPQPHERRLEVRVEASVPLRFGALSEDQAREVREDIASGAVQAAAREAEDPHAEILHRLDDLERLVRRIAERLGVHAGGRRRLGSLRGVRDVNLSASGLRFRTPAAVPAGTRVELDFELPMRPPQRVQAILEVTRCEEAADGWLIAGRFDTIREDDRTAVVRYVLQLQRQAAAARGR